MDPDGKRIAQSCSLFPTCHYQARSTSVGSVDVGSGGENEMIGAGQTNVESGTG